ncbi:MAG: nitrate- and nitrite sensing domain-containing protein [Acidimicrobiia bacterium]
MSIRWKLVAVLTVPLLALVGLAFIGIRDRSDQADSARQIRRSVELAATVSAVADALEQEMVHSGQVLGSKGALGTAELAEARKASDAAIEQYRIVVDATPTGGDVETGLAQAQRSLDGLSISRNAVDGGGDQGTNAITVYRFAVARVQEVVNQISVSLSSTSASGRVAAYAALGRTKEARADEMTLLALWATGGTLDDARRTQLSTAQSTATTQSEVFLTLADPADKQRFRSATAGVPADDLSSIRSDVASGGAPSGGDRLTSAMGTLGDLRTLERALEGEIAITAADLVNNAETDARGFLVLAAAALGFALLAASMFGRSIVRPIAQLTRAARRVSNEHLPRLLETLRGTADDSTPLTVEPIVLDSHDELGHLADAFNTIQETAVAVAGEQADMIRRGIGEMFVNLARRNQSLIDRQIGFLDELEANETDPDVLSDLFRLDHLATRMRRNAESLLVLAGTEPPRRWGKPVALSDVVRAAIGEVEDYARVRIVGLDERPVHGAVAADLAHLLAEILDNASQYSPPDAPVEVHGAVVPGGYRIAVRDRGIGMAPDQILESNTLLADPPRTGLHLSRSLGFTVVGRLSQRHGVRVQLHVPEGVGLLATVNIPATLLVSTGAGSTGPGADTTGAPQAQPELTQRPSAALPAPAASDQIPGAALDAPANGKLPSRRAAGSSLPPDLLTAPDMSMPTPQASPAALRDTPPASDSPSARPSELTAPSPTAAQAPAGQAPASQAPAGQAPVPTRISSQSSSQDSTATRGRPDDVPAAVWARLIGRSNASGWEHTASPMPDAGYNPVDVAPAADTNETATARSVNSPPTAAPAPPPQSSSHGVVFEPYADDDRFTVPGQAMPGSSFGQPNGTRSNGTQPHGSPATLHEATTLDPDLDRLVEHHNQDLGTTLSGLPRRKAVDPNSLPEEQGLEGAVASHRSPEEIRSLLSSYRGGLDRGRRLHLASDPDGTGGSDDLHDKGAIR